MIDTINIALSDSTKYDDQDLFQKVSDINTLKQKKPSNFTICDLIQLTLKGHLDMINKDKVKKQYSEFCIQEKDFEDIVVIIRKAIIASKVLKSIN